MAIDEQKSPSSFTEEIIDQMKKSGMKKPDNIPWSKWMGPKRLNSRHNVICYMAACGLRNNKIAEETGLSEARVSTLLGDPKIRYEIKSLQREIFGESAKKRFDNLLPSAIDTIEEVMLNPSEKGATRISAANMIKEASMGKAIQHIDIGGGLFKEMFERLDKKEDKRLTIDVSSPEKEEPQLLPSPKIDENDFKEPLNSSGQMRVVDAWIDENLGEN